MIASSDMTAASVDVVSSFGGISFTAGVFFAAGVPFPVGVLVVLSTPFLTVTGVCFTSGFFCSVRFGAGVGLGGASGISDAGLGVRRFAARLRITRGDGLKPDFCSAAACVGGELSNACVSGRDSLVALLTLVLVTDGTFVDSIGMPNCFSAPPKYGVGASLAIAFSGTGSSTLLFDFLFSNSCDTVFLISLSSAASLGLFSFNEKLSRLCIVSSPICPSGVSLRGVLLMGSTDTKLVRTFDSGRLVSPLLRAAGDRPRTSGEAGWLLLSNIARKLRTPPPLPFDMAAGARVCCQRCLLLLPAILPFEVVASGRCCSPCNRLQPRQWVRAEVICGGAAERWQYKKRFKTYAADG